VTRPLVSIVLVTRDGIRDLETVLDRIEAQQVDFAFETIAVDSGSRDGSAELLRGRVDQYIEIAPEHFDHGETRNLGIEKSRGEFVVLLVQDAVPATDRWLAHLVGPLREDPSAAASYARQLVRPDSRAITRHYLTQWLSASDQPRTSEIGDREAFERLSPTERFQLCVFDNVCSCIRRSVWGTHPFPRTPIAEDLGWARDVLLARHRILYTPDASVVHSHDRSLGYEYRRTVGVHRRLFELFGMRTLPTAAALARAVAHSLALHLRCFVRGPRGAEPALLELARSLGLAFVWPLGQYVGGGRAARDACDARYARDARSRAGV